MPAGRPTDYNEEIATQICDRIIEGESLRSITRDPAMPSIKTVYSWIAKYPEFLKQYEKAKEDQIDTLADEMIDIAVTQDDVQRARLQIDTRKWIAERMKPKKYGPKQDLNLGGQADNPIQIVNFADVNSSQTIS